MLISKITSMFHKSTKISVVLIDLKPVMQNKTRWSSKLHVLRRFLQIREELMEVSDSAESDLPMDRTTGFDVKVTEFKKMLSDIDVVTKSLQSRGHTLADCREDLDVLIETVEQERSNSASVLYRCKLGTEYIASDARIVQYPSFESGVVKFQKGLENEITEEEKEAIESLVESHGEMANGFQNVNEAADMMMSEILAKRRKKAKHTYMNCDFILGSAAEVERLFSIAKNVLTENRRSMTPQLFEALVFLKLNQRFWDAQLVSQAINGARLERAEARIEAHEVHEDQGNGAGV